MSTGISYWDTLEGRLKKAEMQKNGTWKDRNKGKNAFLRIGEFFEGFKVIAGAGVDGSGAGLD